MGGQTPQVRIEGKTRIVLRRRAGRLRLPPLAPCSVLSYPTCETLGATILALISFSWLANGLIDLTKT